MLSLSTEVARFYLFIYRFTQNTKTTKAKQQNLDQTLLMNKIFSTKFSGKVKFFIQLNSFMRATSLQ